MSVEYHAFNCKLSAYLKSKAKNKIHLVEDLIKYLDDLESQYQQLLTSNQKSTLRNCCEWFEVITVVAIYKPNKLESMLNGCKQIVEHIQAHIDEWKLEAAKQHVPELQKIIDQLLQTQDHEMIHLQFDELSKKLNVDKKKLRQMLLEMDL